MLTLKRQTMTWATVDWQVQCDSSRRISFCSLKFRFPWRRFISEKSMLGKGEKKAPEGCWGLKDAASTSSRHGKTAEKSRGWMQTRLKGNRRENTSCDQSVTYVCKADTSITRQRTHPEVTDSCTITMINHHQTTPRNLGTEATMVSWSSSLALCHVWRSPFFSFQQLPLSRREVQIYHEQAMGRALWVAVG